MYRIIWEDREIFDDQLIDDETAQLISPKLEIEIDQAGSLEFIVPPTNWVYDLVEEGVLYRTLVFVVDDNYNDIWIGRAMSYDLTFDNCKRVYCEGPLAWLNDCYPGYTNDTTGGTIGSEYVPGRYDAYWLLNDLLDKYNSWYDRISSPHGTIDKVEFRFRIHTRYAYVTAETDKVAEDQNRSSWDPKTSVYDQVMSLKDTWGGMFMTVPVNTDYSLVELQWWKDMWKDKTEAQAHANAIEAVFGENLIDLTKTRSMENVVTYLHPVGATVPTWWAENKYKYDPTKLSGITYYEGWWINDSGDFVEVSQSNQNRLRYVTSQTLKVDDTLRYYYSGRIKGNYAKWAVLDNHQVPIIVSKSGAKQEKDDNGNWVDTVSSSEQEEITIPKEGKYLRFAWYKDPDQKDEDDHEIDYKNYSFITWEYKSSQPEEEVVVIDSVNNGSPYIVIHPGQIEQYGGAWIEKTVEWPDINQPRGLLSVANDYYSEVAYDELSYEVKFIDMGFVDASSVPTSWRYPKLLDCVHVTSPPHGVDTYMYITRISIPFDNVANTEVTLGKPVNKNLSDVLKKK